MSYSDRREWRGHPLRRFIDLFGTLSVFLISMWGSLIQSGGSAIFSIILGCALDKAHIKNRCIKIYEMKGLRIMADILYTYKKQVYANITNRCDCSCVCCIRTHKESVGEADNLWFEKEPTLEEIKTVMDEFDFTGYEELLMYFRQKRLRHVKKLQMTWAYT